MTKSSTKMKMENTKMNLYKNNTKMNNITNQVK